jgi:hypothetical protein
METPVTTNILYGVVAEFHNADTIVAAADKARAAGYRRMDAYTPFPVHGLAEALEFHDARVPWMIFIAGCVGCCAGYSLQLFTSTPLLDPILKQPFITDVVLRNFPYPMNIGGRPYHSWPSFIPVSYELTILLAALTAFFGMLALNGFPKPYHPIFNARNFERATLDRFFLCIESRDPLFDLDRTSQFLLSLGADQVSQVAEDSERPILNDVPLTSADSVLAGSGGADLT